MRVEIVAGAVGGAGLGPRLHHRQALGQALAVALAAHLDAALLVELGRVDDGVVVLAGEVQEIAAERVAVALCVHAARAVARGAPDAELGHLGLELELAATADHLSAHEPLRDLLPVDRVRHRPGVVAHDAALVPHRRLGLEGVVVVAEEHAVHVHPALVFDVPEDLQADVVAARPGLERQVLLVAARAHGAQDLERAQALPRGRIDVLEEEAAILRVGPDGLAPVGDGLAVEAAAHRGRARLLGHGAVEGPVPRLVVVRVARAAGRGRRVVRAPERQLLAQLPGVVARREPRGCSHARQRDQHRDEDE